MLHHQAFDNSLLANILSTVKDGKVILANNAACKLLGYTQKELLTKTRSDIFDIAESNFKKMLKQRSAEGGSIAVVKVFKKNGQQITCQITSAVFLDNDGVEKSITTILDMSQSIIDQKKVDAKKERKVAVNIILTNARQKKIDAKKEKIVSDNTIQALAKSDARLAQNNEWIKYIAKTSYDVMWDWNVKTGEIYVGDSIEEVFGYEVKENMVNFSDFLACLMPDEKEIVEKKLLKTLASRKNRWKDTYIVRRNDGSVATTTSRASIIRDDEKQAIRLIGAIQDVSRLHEIEKQLVAQHILHEFDSERFVLASKLSFDVIWDCNLLTNEVFLSDSYKDLFGYEIKNNKTTTSSWTANIHPDDKEMVINSLQEAINSNAINWEHAYRFIRADGSIANAFVRSNIFRNTAGKAYRMIGTMQDLSQQKELKETLGQDIKLKEKQIAEAMEDAKDMERADLGKELHDNVNQLLSASTLYLNMAKGGGEDTEMYLNRSSEYTQKAIEEIRKLTKGLTSDTIKNLGLWEAITDISRDTMEVSGLKISCRLGGFKEDNVPSNFKMNLYRIVQEQLNNILKHAMATKVNIKLIQNKASIILTIADDGIGFDTTNNKKGLE